MDLLASSPRLFVFVTVFFLMLGLASGEREADAAARQRLEGFKRGAGASRKAGAGAPFGAARAAAAARRRDAARSGNLLPTSLLSGVEKKLVIAGEPMTMQRLPDDGDGRRTAASTGLACC